MNAERPQPDAELIAKTWHEIDSLIEEIAGLSKADLSTGEFHAEFLRRALSGLAAVGGEIWIAGPAGSMLPDQRVLPAQAASLNGRESETHRRRLASAVLETGKARIVGAHAASIPAATGQGNAALIDCCVNPTEFLLLACPWKVEGEVAGVVEVFQRAGAGPEAERGYLQFLQAMCELLVEFHRNRLLREYQKRAAGWRGLDQFAAQVHENLDLRATAYAIANEGRRLIECDRLSVLVCRSGSCRLLAVSGADVVDRRAGMVQALERLATAVATFGEALWHPRAPSDQPGGHLPPGDLPPEIESLLASYLDESHARALAVIPLSAHESGVEATGSDTAAAGRSSASRPATPGVLVVEQFRGEFNADVPAAASSILPHSSRAIANALELERLPMARLLRAAGKARWFVEARRLPKTILALLATAAVVAALTLTPAEFRVEARGELQPLETRDVFAPADGVVAEVRAAHGQQVRAQQVLLVLRKPELDLEFQRVGGELQTARKKLASIEAERLQNPRDAEEQRRRYGQLTAQQEEVRELIAGLEGQYAILQKKRAELEVRSPVDGQVLTWNLEQLLAARPVNRGQAMMTVANLQGPWQLELRVPDHRVAHVLAAQRRGEAKLEVTFVLASEPGVLRRGTLGRLGMRTEMAEPDGAFVPAWVDIDRSDIPELMPGATVTAKIDCGRRAVGYVWLHDLLDAVRCWFSF